MNLTDIRPNEGAKKPVKRVGRGIGSGTGKTCGRGHKGLKARDTQRPGFEGGQTPLHRRLPHFRGFTQPFKTEYAIVNLSHLEKFEDGDIVTPQVLIEKRIVSDVKDGIKILASGELTKKLTVKAHQFSKSAQEKIESLGGTVETLKAKALA